MRCRGDCGAHAGCAGSNDQDIALVSISGYSILILQFGLGCAYASSDDFVRFDEEGRNLGDELFCMGHQRLAGSGVESGVQALAIAEPELHDAVDWKLVIRRGLAAAMSAVEDEVLG